MGFGAALAGALKGATQSGEQAFDAVEKSTLFVSEKIVAAENDAVAQITEGVDNVKRATVRKIRDVQNAVKSTFGPRLAGQAIQKCPCDPAEKKLRNEERKHLIETIRNRASSLPLGEKELLLTAAQRFETNIKAVELARLARDVYGQPSEPSLADPCANFSPPVGWKRVDDQDLAKLGLRPEDLQSNGSGFRAAVYQADDGTTVLAFKGTEFKSSEDWKNNFEQALGFDSDYYNRAVSVAKKLSLSTDGNFEITGHSLGGGMASAAALATGAPATTFNAAGLNVATIAKYTVDPTGTPPAIQAYQVPGDVLSSGQALARPVAASALLTGHPVTAALLNEIQQAYGARQTLPAVTNTGASYLTGIISPLDPVTRHSMNAVINGIEKQKADDQALLMA